MSILLLVPAAAWGADGLHFAIEGLDPAVSALSYQSEGGTWQPIDPVLLQFFTEYRPHPSEVLHLRLYSDALKGTVEYPYRWDETKGTWIHGLPTVGYRITLDHMGGSGGSTHCVATTGDPLPASLVAPSRLGFTFGGYYDAREGGVQYYSSSMDGLVRWQGSRGVTLYARWRPSCYLIALQADQRTVDTLAKIHDQRLLLSTPPLTRDGYRFTGWNTREDGEGEQYAVEVPAHRNEEITLYAMWEPRAVGEGSKAQLALGSFLSLFRASEAIEHVYPYRYGGGLFIELALPSAQNFIYSFEVGVHRASSNNMWALSYLLVDGSIVAGYRFGNLDGVHLVPSLSYGVMGYLLEGSSLGSDTYASHQIGLALSLRAPLGARMAWYAKPAIKLVLEPSTAGFVTGLDGGLLIRL